MSGINVLSDSLSGGSKLAKASSAKGNNATDSLADRMAEFAAMLSGITSINADPMGQNSTIGQELEAGLIQDPLVQNLEYSRFMLSFLSQSNGLSNLPAGKEANSGNGVNQGTGEGLLAEDNLSMVLLNKLSLDSNEVFETKGMPSKLLQGNNPGTSELDKYRQVIADLLVALSGQITDPSSEGVLAPERGAREGQEFLKLVQGWLATDTSTVEDQRGNQRIVSLNDGYSKYAAQQGSAVETIDNEVQSKILNASSTPKEAINPSLVGASLFVEPEAVTANAQIIDSNSIDQLRQTIVNTLRDLLQGMDGTRESELDLDLQKVIRPLIDLLMNEQETGSRELSPKASSLLTVLNQILSRVQETNLSQGANKEVLQVNSDKLEAINQPKNAGQVSETLTTAAAAGDNKQILAEINQLYSKPLKEESAEISGLKASQAQNPNAGIGFDAKILTGNVADGKTVTIPVWEQISNVFREQVSSRNQELKELDIQLHPADLGRIRIGLRWENGQVHLQVHASEAATGQILQNQLTELRNTLTNQGVNCGMLQMGQPGRDQQQNQNHQGDQFHKSHDSYTNQIEDEEQFIAVNSSSYGELNHRVNVTA